jgi:hypothetical protein
VSETCQSLGRCVRKTQGCARHNVAETERLRNIILDREEEIASQRNTIDSHEGEKMNVSAG